MRRTAASTRALIGAACAAAAVSLVLLPAAARANSACASFTVEGGGYPPQRVGSIVHHLSTCSQVRVMIGRWGKHGYRSTGAAVYGAWSCSFVGSVQGRPGRLSGQRRSASCTAGLHGYVRFRLTAQ